PARSSAVLACIGVALALAAVALSAAARGPLFAAAKSYKTGSGPVSVAIGDLNGDGKLDLVAARTGIASVLFNRGGGVFGNRHDYAAGTRPDSVQIADLNGDGKSDLVVANADTEHGTVSVLLQGGDGTL